MPYGTDRASLQKALDQLKWTARPVQPSAATPGKGLMWLVQAVEAPPDNLVSMAHGDVMITAHKQMSPAQANGATAAVDTIALCGTLTKPTEDLLQRFDPWKGNSLGSGSKAVVAPMTDCVQQLEKRLESSILAKVQQSDTVAQPAVNDRLVELEQKFQQLAGKQQQFEASVQEQHVRASTQMATMQQQITSQSQQLHGHIEAQSQNMQAMLQDQMSQIRALLTKRPRDHEDSDLFD